MTALRVRCVLAIVATGCLFAVAAVAQELTELPPHVVACSPEPFATNVDPGLTEISVTFDRPMSPEGAGFASLRWAGVSPGIRDATPSWSGDGMTCSLSVALVEDVTYAVSVNNTKARGFVDTAGVPAVGFAWAFATGERTEEQFPPCVVASDPEPGATDVDFRLREVSVTFNRPVAPGDFSWVIFRGSGLYPGIRGGELQLSEDRLSASLPVRLSPAAVYSVGLNDPHYAGYKDIYGRPVLPFGLCFRTAE